MVAKVNDKSTKTEIWAAYKELLETFQAAPAVVAGSTGGVNELGAALERSKSELLEKFEAALKAVGGAADDYATAEQQLDKRKAESIERLERSKAELQTAIDQVRKGWEQEQADHRREREREVEDYAYELSKKRRAEEEAFQTKWQTKFAELDNREAALKPQESRLVELERAAEEAPEQLDKAVQEAKERLTKELQTAHGAELKDVKQQAEHQKSLLDLRLQTAEASVTAKDKQLAELQKQLETASAQLKDMAVTVIRASNNSNQPSGQTA
jgi:DNA repair exonuclease SbcCD ATPase subunit